ncbi:MAG: hypothetical protein IJ684_03655 [Bacteroidales bacterium]|nr:hypothetical protein [Bacteroidales bacterium]
MQKYDKLHYRQIFFARRFATGDVSERYFSRAEKLARRVATGRAAQSANSATRRGGAVPVWQMFCTFAAK